MNKDVEVIQRPTYEELEKENASLKTLIKEQHIANDEFWKSVWYSKRRNVELEKELDKYKEMIEDMKCDICGTSDTTLCNYLIAILKKYGEIV